MSDAPDWQRIVTTLSSAGAVSDAPDWERIVVGPGGVPVGGSKITLLQNLVTETATAGTGNYISIGLGGSPQVSGDMVIICPIPWAVDTAGYYAVSGWLEIYSGPGTMMVAPVSASVNLPVTGGYLPNYLPWCGYVQGATPKTLLQITMYIGPCVGNVTLGSPYQRYGGGGAWPLFIAVS